MLNGVKGRECYGMDVKKGMTGRYGVSVMCVC